MNGLILSVLGQVTAIVLVAALLARLVRRKAAARHGLWLGALVWVLASPLVALVAGRVGWPSLAVSVPVARIEPAVPKAAPIPLPEEPVIESEPVMVEKVATIPTIPVVRPVAVRQSWPSLASVGIMLWGLGVLIGLIRIVYGYHRIGLMLRKARPLDHARFGLATTIPVVTSPLAAGPLAAGLFRPRIVLPEGLAESLSAEALREVLIHESAHVTRHDIPIGLLQRLAAALFWPHPLVYYLNSQLSRAREEVCDNVVLQSSDPRSYSRTLPRPHRALPRPRHAPLRHRPTHPQVDPDRPRRRSSRPQEDHHDPDIDAPETDRRSRPPVHQPARRLHPPRSPRPR